MVFRTPDARGRVRGSGRRMRPAVRERVHRCRRIRDAALHVLGGLRVLWRDEDGVVWTARGREDATGEFRPTVSREGKEDGEGIR